MIHCYASESQFIDHLAPVWKALPERGLFIVPRTLRDWAVSRGITPSVDYPDATTREPVLVASYGDVKRVRRHGWTRIAFIEHGIGQSYGGDRKADLSGSYAGGIDRGDVGLFLVPNETCAARWRAAYPAATVEVVGCPKLDTAPAFEPSAEPIVAISFHWECRLTQETRSTAAYYGPVLADLAERFLLIGHGHPRAFAGDRLEKRYRKAGIEIVLDFEEVQRRASVYVCDNSSSIYEFAATGRPVVVLNEPAGRIAGRGYRQEVSHGLRFWEAADVGINVWKPADLPAAIEAALADDHRTAREAALDIVYAYRHGAAERAAGALLAWLGERVEVAA